MPPRTPLPAVAATSHRVVEVLPDDEAGVPLSCYWRYLRDHDPLVVESDNVSVVASVTAAVVVAVAAAAVVTMVRQHSGI